MQTPRTEFAQALKAIANERGLDPSVIIETIKEAIIAAYKRDAREQGEDVEEEVFTVQIDPRDGGAKIFQDKRCYSSRFGRIAAQTAKQVIHQKNKGSRKGAIMDEFSGRVGT